MVCGGGAGEAGQAGAGVPLRRELAARYAESTGRLENALRMAAAQREATAGEAAQRDRELARRQAALGAVLSRLDQPAATGPAAALDRPADLDGSGAGSQWRAGARLQPGR